MTGGRVRGRLPGALLAVLVLAVPALAGCTGAVPADPRPAGTAPADTAPADAAPPAPPAACLLDTGALRAATGLAWTADETAAGATRCVYDPEGGSGTQFVGVDVTPGPATPLDEVAAVCAPDTRTPAGAGFVCRLPGGGVFAATLRDGDLVTVAVASVPAATSADRLAAALGDQLTG